jgi:hypothetical protein
MRRVSFRVSWKHWHEFLDYCLKACGGLLDLGEPLIEVHKYFSEIQHSFLYLLALVVCLFIRRPL